MSATGVEAVVWSAIRQTPSRDSSYPMRDKKRTSSKSSSSTSPCALLRDAYNNCFNRWYAEKFMKGQWDKDECVSEWQKYRACLSQHLEDKHLSRFLEAEEIDQDHLRNASAASQ